ncbi:MAG: hypothetical protein P8103_13890 [Candidatus Thiodiazotropha sp.]|jgi:hypothetical protein
MQSREIVLIGIGEIGGVFARGFLRLGYSIHPVTRDTDMRALARRIETPALVLIAVGESSLQTVLADIPPAWKRRLCLLQNELLPADWRGLPDPTVISIWFEKKPGMDSRVIMPSPVFGPQATLVQQALTNVDIPTQILEDEQHLLRELVVKNLYILTTNIVGLECGDTVEALWQNHQPLAHEVACEVLRLQEAMTGEHFDIDTMIPRMFDAFNGDPAHKCVGRSAMARLERTLEQAARHDLAIPAIHRIAAQMSSIA